MSERIADLRPKCRAKWHDHPDFTKDGGYVFVWAIRAKDRSAVISRGLSGNHYVVASARLSSFEPWS